MKAIIVKRKKKINISEAVPGICQRGIPIPTATCAAGRFISAIHSVTGCSTYISISTKQYQERFYT
jgi:hypothetical protein